MICPSLRFVAAFAQWFVKINFLNSNFASVLIGGIVQLKYDTKRGMKQDYRTFSLINDIFSICSCFIKYSTNLFREIQIKRVM